MVIRVENVAVKWLANADETTALVKECPAGLALGDSSIRCSYFRVHP